MQRLRHLVDDLYQLSVSDMGGLRYQFSQVDLTDCVQSAVEGMRKRAAAMGIELALAQSEANAAAGVVTGLIVAADVRRIDQLLQNLLEEQLLHLPSINWQMREFDITDFIVPRYVAQHDPL